MSRSMGREAQKEGQGTLLGGGGEGRSKHFDQLWGWPRFSSKRRLPRADVEQMRFTTPRLGSRFQVVLGFRFQGSGFRV